MTSATRCRSAASDGWLTLWCDASSRASSRIDRRRSSGTSATGHRCRARSPDPSPVVRAAGRTDRERQQGGSMLGNKTSEQWVAEYSHSHQHPINRLCHTIGIPLIAGSILLFVVAIFVDGLWPIALGLFLVGWMLQFLGHYVEGKPPEFLR